MRARSAAACVAVVVLTFGACADDDDDAADGGPGTTAGAEDGDGEGWAIRTEAPLPLTEVAAAAFEGELWVVGGLTDDGGVAIAVQLYDPESDSWRAGPDLPVPVHHAALVATDTHLVVMGGYRTRAFDPVADVFVLDQDGDGWTEAPALPEPRGAGAAAWDGSQIVYGGGVGPGGLSAEVWALADPAEGEWSRIGELSVARDHLAATSDGRGTVWFLGGREASLERNLGTVDVLRGGSVAPDADVPTARGGVAAFFSPRHGACLAGGEEPGGTLEEVECTMTDGSTAVLPPLGTPRHGLGAAVLDGVAYVVFGGTEPGLSVSGVVEALRLEGTVSR